jgi:hypothetical protein
MPTGEGYLTGRPDTVLGSVLEQDLSSIFYQYSAILNRVARSVTRKQAKPKTSSRKHSCERCVTTISSLNFEIRGRG